MKIQNYHASIEVTLNPQAAVEKINHVAAWWARDFQGSICKTGDLFTIRFGESWLTCKVVDVEPNKTMEWEIKECHLPWVRNRDEWKATNLIWKFSAAENSTRIDFVHVGLIPEVECYEASVKAWDFLIKESLFKWLTENEGQPDKRQWRCGSEPVSDVHGPGVSGIVSPCH